MNRGALIITDDTVKLLLPNSPRQDNFIQTMVTAKEIIITQTRWLLDKKDSFEIKFKDKDKTYLPFCLHIDGEQVSGSYYSNNRDDLKFALYTQQEKIFEFPCWCRSVNGMSLEMYYELGD